MKGRLREVKKLYEYLQQIQVSVETIAHPEVVSCEESKIYYDRLGYDEKDYALCKNIFVRDKKGKDFWLIIVDYKKTIDMDELRKILPVTRRIGLATIDDLTDILRVESGAVSLFSIFNDIDRRVKVIIDEKLMYKDTFAFHPNYRGLTSFIGSKDAIKFLESLDSEYSIVDIPVKQKIVCDRIERPMVKTLSFQM